MDLNLDIRTGVQAATVLAVLGFVLYIIFGIRNIQAGRHIRFFRNKQRAIGRGWRMIFFGVLLLIMSFVINTYAEPAAYSVFPPTVTPSLTPTITITPSASPQPSTTLTPTITETPSETNTPLPTPTPSIPLFVEALFESNLPPSPDSVFSELQFTQGIAEDYTPLNPGTLFQNPVGHLFAVFSYDQMVDGVQWTAIWYRDGDIVHYESQPWDGGSGGLGYTDWDPPSSDSWLPGEYHVVIFLGYQWFVSDIFIVEGAPPTPVDTETPEPSASSTITATPTGVGTVTLTPSATKTRWPSPTVTITGTPSPTRTPRPTSTPWPTITPKTPTTTPLPTQTRTATATQTLFPPTSTPTPTLTRQPTATNPP
jgi:type VI secretion system secreted protein VgrG